MAALSFVFVLLFSAIPPSGAANLPQPNFAANAEAAFRAAQLAYSTNSQNMEACLDLARTAFDWGEFAKSNDEREPIAEVGIGAARAAVRLDIDSAPAHYYLALNLAELTRTKMLGALKLLSEMERELRRSIDLDPKLDYAGAQRALGMLYIEAPGWPTSVGSKSKARAFLEKAVEIAPNYPDNHLSLLETLVKLHDWKAVQQRMAAYEQILPAAKKEFAGPKWEDEWADWQQRWETLQTKSKKP